MSTQSQKTTLDQQAKVEANKIKESLNLAVKNGLSLQDQWQQLLIQSVCYDFRFNDSSYVELVLNRSIEVKFLRTESLAYWIRQIAGYKTTYDDKTNTFIHTKRNTSKDFKSEFGVVFSFDKHHVKALKDKKLFFWNIAPVDNGKILKLENDWDKVSAPFINKLARNILSGQMTNEEVLTHINTIQDQLKTALSDKKNKEWVINYLSQTNEANGVNDKLENGLAELLEG